MHSILPNRICFLGIFYKRLEIFEKLCKFNHIFLRKNLKKLFLETFGVQNFLKSNICFLNFVYKTLEVFEKLSKNNFGSGDLLYDILQFCYVIAIAKIVLINTKYYSSF